jgi:hypothetical protein
VHLEPSEILISYSDTLSTLMTALVVRQWCAKINSMHVVVVEMHVVHHLRLK